MHYWSLDMPYVESFNWDIVLSWFAIVVLGFVAAWVTRYMNRNL